MAETLIHSFAPVCDGRARVLILGSMPGQASLDAGRYYAHPRNSFWKILGACLGFDAGDDYARRLLALQAGGVALWDVLQACTRKGSLDSDINPASMKANDFAGFLRHNPSIRRVCFNGATAGRIYRQKVLPGLLSLEDLAQPLYVDLPSTSPAHAAMSHEQKRLRWREALSGA